MRTELFDIQDSLCILCNGLGLLQLKRIRDFLSKITYCVLMLFTKRRIPMQIRIFLEYKPFHVEIRDEEAELLHEFGKFLEEMGKMDVSQIGPQDVQEFERKICDSLKLTPGLFFIRSAGIKHFLRFYYFHRKLPKHRAGRIPNEKEIKRIREYINEGHSFREARDKFHKNISAVHRMYHYKPSILALNGSTKASELSTATSCKRSSNLLK